jgi:hypothetical protein
MQVDGDMDGDRHPILDGDRHPILPPTRSDRIANLTQRQNRVPVTVAQNRLPVTGLRLFALAILLLIFAASCNPRSKEIQVIPLDLARQPLTLSHLAVSVTEAARYKPPDGQIWPSENSPTAVTSFSLDSNGYSLSAFGITSVAAGEGVDQPGSSEWDAFSWNLSTNIVDSIPLNPQPAQNSIDAYVSGYMGHQHVLIDASAASQSFQISTAGEMIGAPIIRKFMIYDAGGQLLRDLEVDASQYELLPGSLLKPLEGNYFNFYLFFKNAIRTPVAAGSVTRLVEPWTSVQVQEWKITNHHWIIYNNPTELTGYTLDHNLFFLSGKAVDGSPCSYAAFLEEKAFQLPNFEIPGSSDDQAKPLIIDDYLPLVEYDNCFYVYADLGQTSPGKRYVVGLQFEIPVNSGPIIPDKSRENLTNPHIIWASEIPDIFQERMVMTTGPDNRPFILALDRLRGTITVFDPLLGAIQSQTRIPFMSPTIMLPASFCQPLDSLLQRRALIHDPNANEIIELAIEFREPGSNVGVRPLDSPPTG